MSSDPRRCALEGCEELQSYSNCCWGKNAWELLLDFFCFLLVAAVWTSLTTYYLPIVFVSFSIIVGTWLVVALLRDRICLRCKEDSVSKEGISMTVTLPRKVMESARACNYYSR